MVLPADAATKPDLEPRLLKAIGHPIRVDILRLLGERVASPSEIAKAIGQPLNRVAHHVKVLSELDCIELVRTEQVRGAVAHFYRGKERAVVSDVISAQLSQTVRESLTETAFHAIIERVAAAFAAGTFDGRSDRHLSWMPLTLDEAGWAELVALKAAQLEAEWEIEARSIDRMNASGETPISIISANLGFEAAPPSRKAPQPCAAREGQTEGCGVRNRPRVEGSPIREPRCQPALSACANVSPPRTRRRSKCPR